MPDTNMLHEALVLEKNAVATRTPRLSPSAPPRPWMLRARIGRWPSLCLVVVCLGALIAGCAGDDDETDGPAEPSTAVTFAPGATYVALGSSYAAGAGIPPQLEEVCGRSERSYPHLVAANLGLELVDVTCGGATTGNVRDTPQDGNPPQIDAVTADTSLITLTVGGNDVGYASKLLRCSAGGPDCKVDATTQDADFEALQGSLTSLLQELLSKAPSATIVLVTYPRLVTDATCPEQMYSPEEAQLLGAMGERLQATFLDAAEQTDVLVADPYGAEGEHGLCATGADRWVDGGFVDGEQAPAPYHPNADGHEAMARLVEGALGL